MNTFIQKMELLNFGEITDELLSTPIYRTFPLEKLLITLNENTLHLVKPRAWEDPFEAFLLKKVFGTTAQNGMSYRTETFYHERFYGQCWSLSNESDFSWRVYAPNKDGVLVKSTIGKLKEQLHIIPGGDLSLGKVEYLSQDEIQQRYSEIDSTDLAYLIMDSLFIKRKEFAHEKETRIIYFSKDFVDSQLMPVFIGYDKSIKNLANVLFDEIKLDPRIDQLRFNSIRNLIVNLGYKGPIVQSTLYNAPNLSTTIKNGKL